MEDKLRLDVKNKEAKIQQLVKDLTEYRNQSPFG